MQFFVDRFQSKRFPPIEIPERSREFIQLALALRKIASQGMQGGRVLYLDHALRSAIRMRSSALEILKLSFPSLDLFLISFRSTNLTLGAREILVLTTAGSGPNGFTKEPMNRFEIEAAGHLTPNLTREIPTRTIRVIQ
jgi:hypothetical protein